MPPIGGLRRMSGTRSFS